MKKFKEINDKNDPKMPLSLKNYILLLAGLIVIILGFVLMAGGGSDSPDEFNYAMFSWRRITLAPILVIGGFIIGICESLIKGAGATTFSDAFTFALLIVVLAVKPTGLFSENLTEKV
jgi:hypothetical protein